MTTLMNSVQPAAGVRRSVFEKDIDLVDGVAPRHRRTSGREVLLTGATGYLGRHVLHELLKRGEEVCCLARANADHAGAPRVLSALQAVNGAEKPGRVRIVDADLAAPHLGLEKRAYESLSERVSMVIHCAADVSWARSYAGLRDANVLPVAELLRFACAGSAKRFCLVSTMAVGYSSELSRSTGEHTDPWEYLDNIPLGYAQSKAVAERLVREVAARGLKSSIVRPALLLSTRNGAQVNSADFVAWMVEGCVRLGYAPDVDWKLDVVPVDYAAQALVAHAVNPELPVLHIAHPRPKDWREVVLFMNMYGYRIRLEPFADWCHRLAASAANPSLQLKRFLNFFTACPYGPHSVSQIYEMQGPPRCSSQRSHAELQRLGLPFPRLDARYFDQYLRALHETGVLPAANGVAACFAKPPRRDGDVIERLKSSVTVRCPLNLADLRPAPFHATHGISNEIASWRYGSEIGLHGVSDGSAPEANFVLKVHPARSERLDILVEAAEACSDELGEAFRRFAEGLEFGDGDSRESAVYSVRPQPALERHIPKCYGIASDPATGRTMVLLERLRGLELMDSVDRPEDWTGEYVEAAIRGLARVHASTYVSAGGIAEHQWLVSAPHARRMQPLWQALFEHARPYLAEWDDGQLARSVRDLVHGVDHWSVEYDTHPKVLVHNDCNPRNAAFRREAGELVLCLYDWELAVMGPPQRDLAELLCFVLLTHRVDEASRYVELHRTEFSRLAGITMDPLRWRKGFALALGDFMVKRVNLYVMLHRFVRQPFLPRVVRSWQALFEEFGQHGLHEIAV